MNPIRNITDKTYRQQILNYFKNDMKVTKITTGNIVISEDRQVTLVAHDH